MLQAQTEQTATSHQEINLQNIEARKRRVRLTGEDCEWFADTVVCISHHAVLRSPSRGTQCRQQCWTESVQTSRAPTACHPCTSGCIWISLLPLSSLTCSQCGWWASWLHPAPNYIVTQQRSFTNKNFSIMKQSRQGSILAVTNSTARFCLVVLTLQKRQLNTTSAAASVWWTHLPCRRVQICTGHPDIVKS